MVGDYEYRDETRVFMLRPRKALRKKVVAVVRVIGRHTTRKCKCSMVADRSGYERVVVVDEPRCRSFTWSREVAQKLMT